MPQERKSWRLATPTAQTVMRRASVLGKGPQYRSSRKGTVRKTDGGGGREVQGQKEEIKMAPFPGGQTSLSKGH